MINDFLKKYQEELISDRIQLKEDMDLLDTKIKEETKFLSVLEESNEVYFKEFTPRDINAKNNEKAEEIRTNLVDLNNQMSILTQKMKFFDSRLVEINALLTNTAVVNRPAVQDKTEENISSDIKKSSNSELIASLSAIKEYVVLDPYRAQVELEKIISDL
jgi:two-component system sensor histidine kinase DegS